MEFSQLNTLTIDNADTDLLEMKDKTVATLCEVLDSKAPLRADYLTFALCALVNWQIKSIITWMLLD